MSNRPNRQPTGPAPAPVVQRLRVQYAKRGRLRFSSHRDVARAMERAVRAAGLPIAYSAGFSPHPKISYVGASPTGVASEAEYLELGFSEPREVKLVRAALDAALPEGLAVVRVVEARTSGLPDRVAASQWEVALPEADPDAVRAALAAFLAEDRVEVDRLTKDGKRTLDARAAVVAAETVVRDGCAILALVVRHTTPAVRPDDILAGLRAVAALDLPAPPAALRLAQGVIDDDGRLTDPLAVDEILPSG